MPRVMVTGVGCATGIGFVKGLRKGFGKDVFILGADSSPLAPLFYTKKEPMRLDKPLVVPKAKDPKYAGAILEICKKNNIDVLVPCTDQEIPVLAKNRRLFNEQGTECVVSSQKTINVCGDKWLTYTELKGSVEIPPTVLGKNWRKAGEKCGFPAIVKPRDGRGSRNIFKVENEEELQLAVKNTLSPIAQSFISGQEYTIDCLIGKGGKIRGIVPRKRIEKWAGLSNKGETVKNKALEEYAKKVCSELDFYGPINIQAIVKEGKPYLIEINPRFAGTGVLSIGAGFNLPYCCVLEAVGKSLPPFKFEAGFFLSRFVEDVFIPKAKILKRAY